MTSKKINKLERPFLEMVKNKTISIDEDGAQTYNGVKLISAPNYGQLLEEYYSNYVNYLVALIDRGELNQYDSEFQAKRERLKTIRSKKGDYLIKLSNSVTKFNQQITNAQKEKNPFEASHQITQAKTELQSVLPLNEMIQEEVYFMNRLIAFYDVQLGNKAEKISSIEYDPHQYLNHFTWNGTYGQFTHMMLLLTKHAHFSGFNSITFSQFLSLFIFTNTEYNEILWDHSLSNIGQDASSACLKWNLKNVNLGELIFYLSEENLIASPYGQNMKNLTTDLFNILDLQGTRSDTKNPEESFRKSITGFGNYRALKSRQNTNPYIAILNPVMLK